MDSSLEGVAYVKHVTAERVVIGCNETGNSFALTCEQGRWIGVETNCSGLFHRESSFYRVAYSLLTVVKISRGARRPLLELVGAKFSVQGVGMPLCFGWRRGVVVSGVRRMNEVNARRARLVPGWVTVFGRVYHLGVKQAN